MAEAAALLGVEQRTVIKYRQQGKIRGEKHGKAWRLWLAQSFIDTIRAERSGTHSGMDPERNTHRSGMRSEYIEAPVRVTPGEIERAIERTGERYVADFVGLYDRISTEVREAYEGQIGAKDAALAAKDETIAELRRRAETAEAELSSRNEKEAEAAALFQRRIEQERRNRASMQDAQDGPGAPERSTMVESASGGVWGRVRRWWRG